MNRRGTVVALFLLGILPALGQPADLSGLTFCIDPGHGGHNPANDRHVVPDPGVDFWESESNLQKAFLLKSLLEEQGATVLLTRYTNDYPNDEEPSLAERVAFSNANSADWFHSIHSNAGGGSANYTLMLVRQKIAPGGDSVWGPGVPGTPLWPQAWDLSRLYMSPYLKSMLRTSSYSTRLDWEFYGGTNGGYTLGVLRGLYMPGQLSEGSMHDNLPETRRLMNNDYRKLEAYALRNSWMAYFNVPADSRCIVAGIQRDAATAKPLNLTRVRLLPLDSVYVGDNYNNGFFEFDNLPSGTYTVRFETPGFRPDSVVVTLSPGTVRFVDRNLTAFPSPAVVQTWPPDGEPAFAANLPITIAFSKPMDTASVRANIVIAPPAAGTFTWSNSNSTVAFYPDSVLQFWVTYTIRVNEGALSSTGYALDGNGDGVSGDPYEFQFTTTYVDVVPPAIVRTSAEPGAVLATPPDILNLLFSEPLNAATVNSANISLQEVGGSLQYRLFEYSGTPANGGVTMYLPLRLKAGKAYTLRVTRVADTLGNGIPISAPVAWDFSVGPDQFTYDTIDSLKTSLKGWRQPAGSPATTGVASSVLAFSTAHRFPITSTVGATPRLTYTWDTLATDCLVDVVVDSGTARVRTWRSTGSVLQAYVHGDASGDQFRFVVEDSTSREVSRWCAVDWVGWKIVEWDQEHDSVGHWIGDGTLEGELRFAGFQVRRLPGGSSDGGQIHIAGLQVAKRVVTSVGPPIAGLLPDAFSLEQNYPNPFNPTTRIRYHLPASGQAGVPGTSDVRLSVYDMLGREVEVLVQERKAAGRYEVQFNASRLSSGVYVYRLTAGRYVESRKMVLMK